jgi:Methylamine utilisation protein MauE
MIITIREMQVPVLALIMLGACAVKLSRVLRARSMLVVLDATALFPARLRRPAMITLCATEMSLGILLLVTAGRVGAAGRADGVRLTVSTFFLVGMCALVELREHRPDLGCGCFGEFSVTPPGVRSIARAGLLASAALAAIHIPPLHPPPPGRAATSDLAIILAELLLLAALSPEVGQALARLGYSEPCELRLIPPERSVTSLRRSRAWRRHAHMLISDSPADMWRELCWWYFAYPARGRGADCDVVFAVEVKPRRPAIRVAVVWPDLPLETITRAAHAPPAMRSAIF